jgi:hypothetical protein
VIPTGKLGGQLIASKRALLKRYEQLTQLTGSETEAAE